MFFPQKITFLFLIIFTLHLSAQQKSKDYSKILYSTNIYEIDAFLKIAHPDEPKRSILKPRLIKLLNEYIKTAHPADQRVKDFQEKIALLRRKPSTKISFEELNEINKQKQIAKYKEILNDKSGKRYRTKVYGGENIDKEVTAEKSSELINPEEEEFKMLMSVSPIEHKNTTLKILNSLFDNDPKSTESIVMIENNSDCNMIVRIEGIGHTKYRLAIPAKGDNTIVVGKGDYLFSSLVCGSQYASQKTVQKAIMVSLGDSQKK